MPDGWDRRRRILLAISVVITVALKRSPALGFALLALLVVAALFLPFVARAVERRRAKRAGNGPVAPFH